MGVIIQTAYWIELWYGLHRLELHEAQITGARRYFKCLLKCLAKKYGWAPLILRLDGLVGSFIVDGCVDSSIFLLG